MRTLLAAALLFLALLWAPPLARADEDKVPLDKVPPAVLDAVKAKFPGAKLKGATTEKEDGKTVYEIELIYKEHHHDVTLEPEGKIVSIERQIAKKDLPDAVARALEAKYPKATWKILEELMKGDAKVYAYEVLLVTADRQSVEVVLDPQGTITKEEKKGAQDK